jgi:putative FmdB family regulatory protein
MPTYEYRCNDCGENLEVVQSFSDDPLTVCPNCAGTLKKKFNAVGISFKGSGFYKNDSRSSSSSTSGSSSDPSSGSSDSSKGSSDSSSGSSGSSSSGSSSGTSSSGSSSGPSTSTASAAS